MEIGEELKTEEKEVKIEGNNAQIEETKINLKEQEVKPKESLLNFDEEVNFKKALLRLALFEY